MISRRQFLKLGAVAGTGVFLSGTPRFLLRGFASRPRGSLPPGSIPKYADPLVVPPAMPRSGTVVAAGQAAVDYYEIALRQFSQTVLPGSMGLQTTVWSYGSANHPGTFNFPAFTIEASVERPVRVKWINDLKDPLTGNYLPHILPVDPTLHWANPPGGAAGRDSRPSFSTTPDPYRGPVPMVTHVHGAHTTQESDGYAEAWYLPAATNISAGYATTGTFYEEFKALSPHGSSWQPGTAVFEYPNTQRAGTLWYHDHTLGLTRLNVYAGPAGFYILRGGPGDVVTGVPPGPAPALGDPPGMSYYEIPLAIQDRSFNEDGSLFYPDSREFFDEYEGPFIPDTPVSPIWNPEFFGQTIVVNGRTWPYLTVERRRYRFRILNGCNSRFLILKMSRPDVPFWQIGVEGGFLAAPLERETLLLAPAERADVIVDFTNVPAGTEIVLLNLGPDEPFGGGVPGVDFEVADPDTTGQVMQFRVVPAAGTDPSTPAHQLGLPAVGGLGPADHTRAVTLNEEMYMPTGSHEEIPVAALLGTPHHGPMMWDHPISENPALNATEIWEIINHTADAHPIHIHEVMFQVVNREKEDGTVVDPENWELGWKDTVIAYPGETTRVKARFDLPGLYVWHCHIVEHEDNEMMRPLYVGPMRSFKVHLPIIQHE